MPQENPLRSRLTGIALCSVGLRLLGRFVWSNRGAVRDAISHRPDGRHLALAFALALVAMVSTFSRGWVVVRARGLPLRFVGAVRVGFVGNTVDLVIPRQVCGDVFYTTRPVRFPEVLPVNPPGL
jgi:hypothetical protein